MIVCCQTTYLSQWMYLNVHESVSRCEYEIRKHLKKKNVYHMARFTVKLLEISIKSTIRNSAHYYRFYGFYALHKAYDVLIVRNYYLFFFCIYSNTVTNNKFVSICKYLELANKICLYLQKKFRHP